MADTGSDGSWFRVRELDSGVFAIEEPFHREQVASYLAVGRDRAVLLDTGMGVAPLRPLVESLTDRPLTVLLSHAHFDHIGGTYEFTGIAPVLIHEIDAPDLRRGLGPDDLARWYQSEQLSGPLPRGFDPASATIPGVEPTELLRGGETLDLGDRVLEVLACPGHAPGLVALLDRDRRALYSTDVAYAGALYAHMAASDLAAYRDTLARLAALAPSLDRLYPSHGERPIPSSYLPRMAAAVDAVAIGRSPDERRPDAAVHAFEGFTVLVPPGNA